MVGFCSSSALVGPRLTAALAEDGVIPEILARRHGTRDVPHFAIALITLGAMGAVMWLPFKQLADLTIITLFCQYVPTCLAGLVFRRWQPDAPRAFRVPLGATIPLLALGLLGLLITRIDMPALETTGVILGVGVAMRLVHRAVKPKAAVGPVGPAV